jgi:hypothetical protein
VAIACSSSPISLDIFGRSRLTVNLTRVKERLQMLVNEYCNLILQRGYKQQYLHELIFMECSHRLQVSSIYFLIIIFLDYIK